VQSKKNVHAERFSMNCAEEWRRETKEPDLSFESSLLPMSDDNPFYLIVPFDVAWKKGQIYAIANVFLIREMLLPTTVIKKHCRCARQKNRHHVNSWAINNKTQHFFLHNFPWTSKQAAAASGREGTKEWESVICETS